MLFNLMGSSIMVVTRRLIVSHMTLFDDFFCYFC